MSEKTKIFCKISNEDMTVTTQDKSKVDISQNFVAFSEYMNFTARPTSPYVMHNKIRTRAKEGFPPKGPSLYYVLQDWLGGFRKWPFLLTFSTDIVNHYIVIESISDIVGGWVRKVQNCADVMQGWSPRSLLMQQYPGNLKVFVNSSGQIETKCLRYDQLLTTHVGIY